MLMGRKFIGIEKDAGFYNIARARLKSFADAIEKDDRPEPKPIRKLSEIESITLNWDKSVIDMQAVPSVIDYTLSNPGENSVYEGVAIETTFTKDNL